MILEILKKIFEWLFGFNQEEKKKVFLPYKKKQFLMTSAEYKFFQVLEQVVDGKYYIVPQLAISDIVEVIDGYKWNKSYRSRIDKKTIDFVLFNKAGYTPYLAIELDDISHEREDRKERDRFVEDVLYKVGIKIVRIKNAYSYNVEEISNLLH